ncbi:hypothetical protein CDAR_495401 [Caerostris darwini]|uniref:Ycf15 n=1 Tax=Caerostris darwini TaxID=1538125 RepID=A0AAV4S8K8_9ARAC|nr:hypothetical protein CDAR_495401 [Caerostris darwini]
MRSSQSLHQTPVYPQDKKPTHLSQRCWGNRNFLHQNSFFLCGLGAISPSLHQPRKVSVTTSILISAADPLFYRKITPATTKRRKGGGG